MSVWFFGHEDKCPITFFVSAVTVRLFYLFIVFGNSRTSHSTLCNWLVAHGPSLHETDKHSHSRLFLATFTQRWPLIDPRCRMIVFPVHQVWPKPSCKAQWKGEEDKADKGRGGKTTSGNGQALSSAGSRGQWRTGENGENWLQNHLWCPNDPRG